MKSGNIKYFWIGDRCRPGGLFVIVDGRQSKNILYLRIEFKEFGGDRSQTFAPPGGFGWGVPKYQRLYS